MTSSKTQRYDFAPTEDVSWFECTDGDFVKYEAYQQIKKELEIVKKALKDWIEWEDEQIKKYGPYVGKRINELIAQGREALEVNHGKK